MKNDKILTLSHEMEGGGSATMKQVIVTGRLTMTDFSITGLSKSNNRGGTVRILKRISAFSYIIQLQI